MRLKFWNSSNDVAAVKSEVTTGAAGQQCLLKGAEHYALTPSSAVTERITAVAAFSKTRSPHALRNVAGKETVEDSADSGFPGAGGGGKRATATSSGGARGSEPAQEERAGGGLGAPCLLLALEGAQKHLPPRLPLYQHPLQNQRESPRLDGPVTLLPVRPRYPL